MVELEHSYVKISIVDGSGATTNWTTISEDKLLTDNYFNVIYDLFRAELEDGDYEIVVEKINKEENTPY